MTFNGTKIQVNDKHYNEMIRQSPTELNDIELGHIYSIHDARNDTKYECECGFCIELSRRNPL